MGAVPLGALLIGLFTALPASLSPASSAPVVATASIRPAAMTYKVPTGLPRHLGLGLSASPADVAGGGWMPSSGVPWDYAYQYLAGGVNTPGRWQTWNPAATFPLNYARAARADGYVPVFTYYEMLQSTGPCSACGEAQRDLSHLNDAGIMAAYFADFATLMQRLGSRRYGGVAGYGGRAVVQVEPDLSGFANQAVLNPAASCFGLCTGTSDQASSLRAAVASSGFGAVAGYPNNYRGFSLALAHLRDLYAPGVILGFHVSDWATGTDIGSNRATNINATGLGQQAAAFARSAGADGSAYQVVFNDVADRDSAVSGIWWDQTNRSFPDFSRWEAYLGAVTASTGLPAFVWQVPEGNQYFDTENNSAGHTQDNRAQYFLAHPTELTAAGVMAVLFGRGNPGSTTVTDAEADGVTNPAPVCNASGGIPICASHHSKVSDDDGGFLRSFGALYYFAGPVPLG